MSREVKRNRCVKPSPIGGLFFGLPRWLCKCRCQMNGCSRRGDASASCTHSTHPIQNTYWVILKPMWKHKVWYLNYMHCIFEACSSVHPHVSPKRRSPMLLEEVFNRCLLEQKSINMWSYRQVSYLHIFLETMQYPYNIHIIWYVISI